MNIEALVMSGGAPVVGPMVAGEAAAAGFAAALAAAVPAMGVQVAGDRGPEPALAAAPAAPILLRSAAATAAGDAVFRLDAGVTAPEGPDREAFDRVGRVAALVAADARDGVRPSDLIDIAVRGAGVPAHVGGVRVADRDNPKAQDRQDAFVQRDALTDRLVDAGLPTAVMVSVARVSRADDGDAAVQRGNGGADFHEMPLPDGETPLPERAEALEMSAIAGISVGAAAVLVPAAVVAPTLRGAVPGVETAVAGGKSAAIVQAGGGLPMV